MLLVPGDKVVQSQMRGATKIFEIRFIFILRADPSVTRASRVMCRTQPDAFAGLVFGASCTCHVTHVFVDDLTATAHRRMPFMRNNGLRWIFGQFVCEDTSLKRCKDYIVFTLDQQLMKWLRQERWRKHNELMIDTMANERQPLDQITIVILRSSLRQFCVNFIVMPNGRQRKIQPD